jgi:hypothetical protein
MSFLSSEKDTIVPIFGVGREDHDAVVEQMKALPNISTEGIFPFDGMTNHVHYAPGNADVMSHHVSAPIPFQHIRKFLNADGIYINMISGSDITIETLDEIRLDVRPRKIPIHLDLHCLTLHINDDGARYSRPMSDWRRWCFMVDSVQMNEEEAAGVSIEKFSDELLAKQMMPLMVQAFIITRGRHGVTLYRADHKHLIRKDFPAEPVESPVSEIGAGDIFGASYFYAIVKKKKPDEAAQFAVKAATQTVRYPSQEKHRSLADLRREL